MAYVVAKSAHEASGSQNQSVQPVAEEHFETIEFIKKGQITIPKRIRDAYHIEAGQKGTLVELNGAMLILPRLSETPALFDAVREGLGTEDMSLEDMVLEMRHIRETSNYETTS